MEKDKWLVALVPMMFKKLKGCVRTEKNTRYVAPGQLFMILSDEARGTWIGIGYKGSSCREATEEEISRIK